MKGRRLKRGIIYTLYIILVLGFCTSLYFIEKGFDENKDNNTYVDKVAIDDADEPVVKTESVLIKPYTADGIEILSNYYDSAADETTQQNSIIYYDGTYMQNSGVIYGSENQFDVVAIYDGEVIKVDTTDLLGKVVEIQHSNDIISVYQLLGDVNVEVNQKVTQGAKIGVSSLSNIINNNKQQLYFELIVRGKLVNGEEYFGKKIEEI